MQSRGRQPFVSLVEVELDVFSGIPIRYGYCQRQMESFFSKACYVAQASATELHDDLGYRGFIVEVINETEASLIRIQNGTVQLSQNDTNVYYSDQDRHLERWLLNSGEPALRSDLFKIVESEFPENSTNLSYQRVRQPFRMVQNFSFNRRILVFLLYM